MDADDAFQDWNVKLEYNGDVLAIDENNYWLNEGVVPPGFDAQIAYYDYAAPMKGVKVGDLAFSGDSGDNDPWVLATLNFTVTSMGESNFKVLTASLANDTSFYDPAAPPSTAPYRWQPGTINVQQVTAAPDVQFSSATYEVDEGVGTATITATLNPTSTQPVTVSYATSDGTATIADGDYNAASGQWVFNPGEQQKTFDVTIIDDDIEGEPDETVNLTLSSPENANLGTPNPATLTILDNDCAPVSGLNFTYDPASPLVNDTVTFTGSVTGGTPIIHLGLTLAGRARRAARTLTLSPIPPLAPSPSRWTWRMSTAMIARRST